MNVCPECGCVHHPNWERELLGMRVDPGEFASEEPA